MAPGTLNKKDNKGRKGDPLKGTSKSGIHKAESSQKPSKEKRKEVQENIRQAKLDWDGSQSQIEKQKQKLEELANLYNDGEHPEHKEAYDALVNEIQTLNATLGEKQNKVKKLEKDLGEMDGVEQTGPSPSTSGTNPHPADSTSGNVNANDPDVPLNTTENADEPMDGNPDDDLPDSGYEDDEEDDEEDKWSPSLSRKRAGLTKNDLRLEGKVKRWKQWKFVMANGPKNSTSYRLCKANDMEEFDDPAAENLMESRLGEKKDTNGKTFTYGKSHAKTIQGVAWFVDESLMNSHPDDFPTPLDLLKPKKLLPLLTTTVHGEKITTKMKVVDCVVKIKWLIGEAYISTWESRQTVRRIWGLERGDKGIFEAAQHQEKLFNDWFQGKREGRDRSGTPFRGFDRGETPGPEEDLGKKVHFQQSLGGSQTAKMSLRDWKNEYFELNDIEDPKKMTDDEKKKLNREWREYRG